MLGSPTRNRISERREATRREILAAAWDIAREVGLAQLTLRDVAERVGMRAPSLYTHFDSKLAIYDAMFGQAWTEYELSLDQLEAELSDDPRTAIHQVTRHFYDFAVADHSRYQLMNERVIPGFTPSQAAFAPSLRVFERGRRSVLALGGISEDQFVIWVSLLGGLVNQHFANDPHGTRFSDLLPVAVDLWADAVGLVALGRAPSPRQHREMSEK
jgi:AcrR family transcriptional regulator